MGVSDYSFPVVVRPSAYPWTTAARLEWVGWCHRAELPCGASSDNHPHVSRDLEPASPAQQKKWIAAKSGVDTADFSICPCLNRSEQQITSIELVINVKTGRALGVTIPETLPATANEAIQ
jgi:hypothetical protein